MDHTILLAVVVGTWAGLAGVWLGAHISRKAR